MCVCVNCIASERCFKLLVGCTSSSVIIAVRNKCMSETRHHHHHPPPTLSVLLTPSFPSVFHFRVVYSIIKGSVVNMASICAVVAHIFLCLNIVKVCLVNSSELNGDIPATEPSFHNPARDMITVHMYRVYDKYSKKHHHQHRQNVNTIRSFRGVQGE